MVHASFTIKAMIHSDHIYRDIWSAVIGEKLPCKKGLGSLEQKFLQVLIFAQFVFEICQNLHHSEIFRYMICRFEYWIVQCTEAVDSMLPTLRQQI